MRTYTTQECVKGSFIYYTSQGLEKLNKIKCDFCTIIHWRLTEGVSRGQQLADVIYPFFLLHICENVARTL